MENAKIDELVKKGKIPMKKVYPYHLGIYRNFQSVFGEKWYLWLVPAAAIGDGTTFDVNEASLANNDTAWPPREYYLYKKYPYGKPPKQSHSRSTWQDGTFIRNDSEGHLVSVLTTEERERMLRDPAATEKSPLLDGTAVVECDQESSTDFDSIDEDDDDDTDGIPRVSSKTMDSDDEVLAVRKERMQFKSRSSSNKPHVSKLNKAD